MAYRPSDHINKPDTENKCASPHQQRRRRKETLLGKLHAYCLECYSDVDLVLAEYPIQKSCGKQTPPIHFSAVSSGQTAKT
ncbi:hypothetical protein I7I50_04027 [Histoplasma capsulatum G186AR]|nr:hypothetical protein I7I52_04934 [Histoplasma capsulatum]QSS75031.1 hypothetical protein I7I50_04027 [Histoplasma capsulatum G186AR]